MVGGEWAIKKYMIMILYAQKTFIIVIKCD